MTEKARTRRKHQRKCARCRCRYAALSWLYPRATGNHCPRCVERETGEAASYGAGSGEPLYAGQGRKTMRPDDDPWRAMMGRGPALAPAHRKHVRRHRPGVREAKR